MVIYIFALWRLSGAFRGRLPIQSKNNYFFNRLTPGYDSNRLWWRDHGRLPSKAKNVNELIRILIKIVMRKCWRTCWRILFRSQTFWHTPAKYMTLGPKFFCFSKMAVTRRRKHLNQYFLAESPPLGVSYLSSPSKQVLKHFSKIDIIGFTVIVFPYSC